MRIGESDALFVRFALAFAAEKIKADNTCDLELIVSRLPAEDLGNLMKLLSKDGPSGVARNLDETCRKLDSTDPIFACEVDHEVREVLTEFIHDIDQTGGAEIDGSGVVRPEADPDWLDLGDTYLKACKVLGLQPKTHLAAAPVEDDDEAIDLAGDNPAPHLRGSP